MHFYHHFLLIHIQHKWVSVVLFRCRIVVRFLWFFLKHLCSTLCLCNWFSASSDNTNVQKHVFFSFNACSFVRTVSVNYCRWMCCVFADEVCEVLCLLRWVYTWTWNLTRRDRSSSRRHSSSSSSQFSFLVDQLCRLWRCSPGNLWITLKLWNETCQLLLMLRCVIFSLVLFTSVVGWPTRTHISKEPEVKMDAKTKCVYS